MVCTYYEKKLLIPTNSTVEFIIKIPRWVNYISYILRDQSSLKNWQTNDLLANNSVLTSLQNLINSTNNSYLKHSEENINTTNEYIFRVVTSLTDVQNLTLIFIMSNNAL
jgi:hypothetical protein